MRSQLKGVRGIGVPDFETFFPVVCFSASPGIKMSENTECQLIKVWHEIELSQKSELQLFFKLQGLDRARQSNLFSRLVWWSNERIRAKLIKSLQRERIPYVFRQPSGRFARDLEREGWSPKKLFSVSEFRDLPRIPN